MRHLRLRTRIILYVIVINVLLFLIHLAISRFAVEIVNWIG